MHRTAKGSSARPWRGPTDPCAMQRMHVTPTCRVTPKKYERATDVCGVRERAVSVETPPTGCF